MVKQAQANVDQAALNLSYTRIIAPADGIIGNRSAQLGQRVQPGQSLMALTQHEFWVTANFKETQLARMRHGSAGDDSLSMRSRATSKDASKACQARPDRFTTCFRRKTRPATT